MRSALMLYASDIVDEGFEVVFERARERGGVDALELGAIYHHGRDLYPHNPRHKLLFLDGGRASSSPTHPRSRVSASNPSWPGCSAEVDPMRRIVARARRRVSAHAPGRSRYTTSRSASATRTRPPRTRSGIGR